MRAGAEDSRRNAVRSTSPDLAVVGMFVKECAAKLRRRLRPESVCHYVPKSCRWRDPVQLWPWRKWSSHLLDPTAPVPNHAEQIAFGSSILLPDPVPFL